MELSVHWGIIVIPIIIVVPATTEITPPKEIKILQIMLELDHGRKGGIDAQDPIAIRWVPTHNFVVRVTLVFSKRYDCVALVHC